MKKLLLAFFTLALSFQLSAQSPIFQWVETQPVDWEFNPAMVNHLVVTDGLNRNIEARFLAITQLYGSDLYGNYTIETRDADAIVLSSLPLSGKVLIHEIAADDNGNIYVGGSFMGVMQIGTSDSLVNTNLGDTLNINSFILKVGVNGMLQWARNMELTHPGLQRIDDIRIDQQQTPWYAYSEWMTGGHIVKLDADGGDVGTPLTITGVNGVSSFDFDPQGNIFLVGSAPNGTATLGSLTYTLTEQYNFYIARFDNNGIASWAKFAHDVTFQFPQVVTDPFGNAFVGCGLMDSTTWGTIHFTEPQWVYDFFLVKVDQGGNFLWGQQTPQAATLEGDIQPASSLFLASDALGNAYFLGNLRGAATWSNGLVSETGALPSSGVLLVKFDAFAGFPVWTVVAGVGNSYTHQLAMDQNENLYFTQTATDTSSYGFISVEIPNYSNMFLLAKLTYLQDTTLNSIEQNVVTEAIDIYPNPTATSIIVPQELQGSDLSIVDVTGKEVAYHQGVGTKINVQSLPSGCYFLQFRAERIRFIGKLIKE